MRSSSFQSDFSGRFLVNLRTLRIAFVLRIALIAIMLAQVCVAKTVRFASFNVALYDASAGKLAERLSARNDSHASAVAEIIQRVRPDVLLLCEIDYDPHGSAITNFQTNYLAVGQNLSQSAGGPAERIEFPYRFQAPSNTGSHSGYDLDRNGRLVATAGSRDYGGDCWGYGEYPGKYGMVLLSRYPIDHAAARTFKSFLWKDMPGAKLPDNVETAAPDDWYPAEVLERFPLSSKSHWDIPIRIAGRTIHVLASHPTPPTFDGPEDRNGRRNHDEIRFWVDYIDPANGGYHYDDNGVQGGLPPARDFMIMGDLNGDPNDGQGKAGITRLLNSPRVSIQPAPKSKGGAQQAKLQGGANELHLGDPSLDTLDASDRVDANRRGPGNLRVDYVIPASRLNTLATGVFWPENENELFPLVGTYPFPGSDHRLVWVDVEFD